MNVYGIQLRHKIRNVRFESRVVHESESAAINLLKKQAAAEFCKHMRRRGVAPQFWSGVEVQVVVEEKTVVQDPSVLHLAMFFYQKVK